MKVLISLIILFNPLFLPAQNLLPNASFEIINYCESKIPCSPSGWYSVSNIPYGYQNDLLKPFKGKHAIALLIAFKKETRSYWQTKLLCDLQPGQQYLISFYLFDPKQNFNPQYLGVHFNETLINAINDTILSIDESVAPNEQRLLKNGWYKITRPYVATGKERFLLIGNLNNQSNNTILEKENRNTKYLEYYIDEISLSAVDKKTNKCAAYNFRKDSLYTATKRHTLYSVAKVKQVIKDTLPLPNIPKPDTLVLDKLTFNFDSDTLVNTKALDIYFNSLNIAGIEKIEIVGFTDSTGDKAYNLKLSIRRALSVKNHIVQNYRIPESYIIAIGNGISIAENLSENNRRVELKIYKKN